jgi:uncharacterized protein (TIGR03437 family)
MFTRTSFCLALWSTTAAIAASSGLPLGVVDYSEWANPDTMQIAADGTGALYMLFSCTNSGLSPSCVIKLTADGKTIVWQNALGFTASAMAVDPRGGVYVTSYSAYGESSQVFVEKLTADGTSVAWRTQIGSDLSPSSTNRLFVLAVDSTGRAFAGGYDEASGGGYVVRLNAAGAVDYTTSVTGGPSAIAVDPTGSSVVVGIIGSSVLAWLAPDRDTKFYATVPQKNWMAVAVAPNGDAILYSSDYLGHWLLQRFEPTGAVRFSEAVLSGYSGDLRVAVDAAGNAYITGYSGSAMYPVRSSLAPCGTAWLSVVAPDGSILQTTYIPGVANGVPGVFIATSPNSTVFVVALGDTTFAPSQAGPFAVNGNFAAILLRLSSNANAQTLPLACVGNSASYSIGPIAPGGMVTLFGSGLGPQQGIETHATLQSPFPTQAANVEVTFDGRPAPLLWVQDGQINAVAPWSLTPGQTTQVCVTNDGVKTNCLTWPVTQASPGVFTVDGVHAAALNQDGTINSAANPAPQGSIVSVFATGLGPISPPQADGSLVGLPLPVNELPLRLGYACLGIFCTAPHLFDALYGGPAPFLIAGASQVNFQANSSLLYLAIAAPSLAAYSNNFQVYVAGQ